MNSAARTSRCSSSPTQLSSPEDTETTASLKHSSAESSIENNCEYVVQGSLQSTSHPARLRLFEQPFFLGFKYRCDPGLQLRRGFPEPIDHSAENALDDLHKAC